MKRTIEIRNRIKNNGSGLKVVEKLINKAKELKKVAVLFGGCSSEYEVSLQSAYSVIEHINRDEYKVVLIGINKAGEWFLFEDNIERIKDDTWEEVSSKKVTISVSREEHGIIVFEENKIEKIRLDAVYPVLHGKNGEDGTIQGLCELAGIPVVGCDMLSSALCMDKQIAHDVVAQVGVKVPKGIVIDEVINKSGLLDKASELNFPLYIKPMRAGSSFGITKVQDISEVYDAVNLALKHDSTVIIEENIEGFEVGCAILGNGKELIIGEVDEIELSDGFFDFTEKYTLKSSKIHMPARIDEELKEKVKSEAIKIYNALKCKNFARVDMFITPEKEIVFNEVNTIPGCTAHSRYPNMLKGIGISFEEFINKAIGMVINNESEIR